MKFVVILSLLTAISCTENPKRVKEPSFVHPADVNMDISLIVVPLNTPVVEASVIFELTPLKDIKFDEVSVRVQSKSNPQMAEIKRNYPVERDLLKYLLRLPTREFSVDSYKMTVLTDTSDRKWWQIWKPLQPFLMGRAEFEVQIAKIIVDGDPQPPHPGEAGKKTLQGIDSDNDGLRDDVEIWINESYQDKNLREIIKKQAKIEIQMMLAYDNKAEVRRLAEMLQLAVICLSSRSPNNSGLFNLRRIDVAINDTPERIRASFKAEAQLAGTDLSDEVKEIFKKERDDSVACSRIL